MLALRMSLPILVVLILVGAIAAAQTPELVLSFDEIDSLTLAAPGRVTGWTFMGPDTLVVLSDTPDSLSESGDREIRLVFQDREGSVLLMEDFTGVLERGLAWDGEFDHLPSAHRHPAGRRGLRRAGPPADGDVLRRALRLDRRP